jgi:rfaE bifunctional protein kinase chain/domain
MKRSGLLSVLDSISQIKILVVGDVMLDRYWWGNASRLSPEAPVPVVALKEVSNIPGGAANVAANIAGLGATVILTGLIGSDDAGALLRESLLAYNISPDLLISSKTRPTTTKTRVLVHNQQIARIDEETDDPLTEAEEVAVLGRVKDVIADVDAVVLSDYAKGCLTRTLVASVIAEAKRNGKTVLVDPKSRDLTKYSGATLLTPNLTEALNAAGIENGGEAMADVAAKKILAETSVESLLITLGEHGMKLFRTGEEPVHFPSMARQVFDVTGAGDTVVALLAAALGASADIHSAIEFANIGAGLAVEKVGTTIVSIDELRLAIGDHISHLDENH